MAALMMSSRSIPVASALRVRPAAPAIAPCCFIQKAACNVLARPSIQARPLSRKRSQIRASSSSPEATTTGSGVAGPSPYVPLVAAVGFAAAWFQKYSAQEKHVLVALAGVALAQSALSLVFKSSTGDWVSNVAAPAVLAWNALNLRFHYMEVAIAVFGWYLCKNLQGPAIAWAATLAAALYYKVGAEWYAVAYAVVAGFKLLRGYQKDSKVALQMAPPVLASAWALYKNCPLTWTIILMLSQIAGSAFGLVKAVSTSEEEPNIA